MYIYFPASIAYAKHLNESYESVKLLLHLIKQKEENIIIFYIKYFIILDA